MRKLLTLLLLMLVFELTFLIINSGRRIPRMLAEYRSSPTMDRAEQLAGLLDNQKVKSELGNEILKELVTPLLHTRPAYSVDKPVNFSLTRRYYLRFSHMNVSEEEHVDTADGLNLYGGSSGGGNSVDSQPRFLHYHPQPEKPGDYKLQVRYRYKLTPTVNGVPPRQKPSGGEAVYQCEFIIPVELKVVSKELADSVAPVSSPDLDAEMKAAFVTYPSNQTYTYGTPSGRRISTVGYVISYYHCPADASFKMSFRFENGDVKTSPTGKRIRQGSYGQIQVDLNELAIEQTGTHSGTLILSPDFECAYIDPEINSIWSGSLEFPMSITVNTNQ